jgi:hypothetical protein
MSLVQDSILDLSTEVQVRTLHGNELSNLFQQIPLMGEGCKIPLLAVGSFAESEKAGVDAGGYGIRSHPPL